MEFNFNEDLLKIANRMNVQIRLKEIMETNATYHSNLNVIEFNMFPPTPYNVNQVLAHELIHATGFILKRPLFSQLRKGYLSFDIDTRIREEHVAEYGSMIVCKKLGIEYNKENCLDYLKGYYCKNGLPALKERQQAKQATIFLLEVLLSDIKQAA